MKKIISLLSLLLLLASCQGEPFVLEEPYSVGIVRSGPKSEFVYYDEDLNEIDTQELKKLVVPPFTRYNNELLLYGYDNDFVLFKMNTIDGSLKDQQPVRGQLINSTFDDENIYYLRLFNDQSYLVKNSPDQHEIDLTAEKPKSVHLFNDRIIVVTGDQNQTLQIYNNNLELETEIETQLMLSHRSLINQDKLLFLGKGQDKVMLFELDESYQVRSVEVDQEASDLVYFQQHYLVLSGSPSKISYLDEINLEVINEVSLDESLGSIHVDKEILYGREITEDENYLVKYQLSLENVETLNKVGTNTQDEEQVFTFIFTP